MKAVGIILLVLGSFNLITGIIAIGRNPDYAEKLSGSFGMALAFVVLGIYLISRANAKRKERIEREKWSNADDK